MKNPKRVIYSFLLATFSSVFFTALFPQTHLFYYAPFLAILFIDSSLIISLWISCLCGFIIDALSTTPMGMHTLGYTLLCFSLFRLKRFFNDKPMNIPIFTIVLSMGFSIIEIIILSIFQKNLSPGSSWIISDLLVMPIFDGIYSIILFVVPMKLIYLFKNQFLIKLSRRR